VDSCDLGVGRKQIGRFTPKITPLSTTDPLNPHISVGGITIHGTMSFPIGQIGLDSKGNMGN
jgi:hypothetical protein